jgi:hypothetical protein
MQIERARPGVQRELYSGLCAQVARVGEQFEQRVACGGEQGVDHRRGVQAPQRVQLMWDGEYHVPVRAVDQSGTSALQPALFSQTVALRAGAVAAGVVPRAFHVPIGAALHVTAQCGGATGSQSHRRSQLRRAQSTGVSQFLQMLPEQVLDGGHRACAETIDLSAFTLVRLLSQIAHDVSLCAPSPARTCGLVQRPASPAGGGGRSPL